MPVHGAKNCPPYYQEERYKETVYFEEKKQLLIQDNGMYTKCIQSVYTGKDSIGKYSIDKHSINKYNINNNSNNSNSSNSNSYLKIDDYDYIQEFL